LLFLKINSGIRRVKSLLFFIKIEAGGITSLGLLSKMESGMSKAYNYHENMDARNFTICGIFFNGVRRATNL
jgi:hypothetical protein